MLNYGVVSDQTLVSYPRCAAILLIFRKHCFGGRGLLIASKSGLIKMIYEGEILLRP